MLSYKTRLVISRLLFQTEEGAGNKVTKSLGDTLSSFEDYNRNELYMGDNNWRHDVAVLVT